MDILRIATAGSVDDGKSTLIGRLLYETKSVTQDKIDAIDTASKKRGLDFLDLSLLTDGLIAEREQGITIDVAHIYFNTPHRKYIIADTPGHFEYTRNMVTGTSNTKVAIILIDARNGVVDQTRRHLFISSLLRIPNVIVAINKMDLVDYQQDAFKKVKTEFERLAAKITWEGQNFTFVPISSLFGQNITTSSDQMPWYQGDALLSILESIEILGQDLQNQAARFPVQTVIRPKTTELHDFRGYAGKVASGEFKVGDLVQAYPSEQTSVITEILKFSTPQETGSKGESLQILLKDDIDISRGSLIFKPESAPQISKELTAEICWFDAVPLPVGKTVLLQHGINRVKAKITAIKSIYNIDDYAVIEANNQIKLNEIGTVSIKLASPIFTDKYIDNPGNGAFILIDDQTNGTVGMGLIA